jgi:hypothetical protein
MWAVAAGSSSIQEAFIRAVSMGAACIKGVIEAVAPGMLAPTKSSRVTARRYRVEGERRIAARIPLDEPNARP